jgi:hypothetical protein
MDRITPAGGRARAWLHGQMHGWSLAKDAKARPLLKQLQPWAWRQGPRGLLADEAVPIAARVARSPRSVHTLAFAL